MNSFRLRMALLSATVAGVVAAAFGVSAWVLIGRANLERVDEEIKARLLGLMATRHDSRHWRDFHGETEGAGEGYRTGEWILLVRDDQDRVAYRSSAWPDTLPPEGFQVSLPDDEGWGARPPRGGERRPEGDSGPPPPPMRHGEGPPPFLADPAFDAEYPDELHASRPAPPPMPHTVPRFETRQADGKSWRLVAAANPNLTIVLGIDLNTSSAQMRHTRNAFLLALPVALLLAASGAMLVARRAFEPILRLTRALEGTSASNLAHRLPTDRTDGEFQRLITVFNAMMDRLQTSFHQAARFSADAAHELNTPLTILQGHLDCMVQGATPGSDEQQALIGLLEQAERLKTIVRNLLLIARADAGQLAKNLEWVDLSGMLESLKEDIETMASHLTVRTRVEPGVGVMADRHLMLRMLHNLASNAVKYNSGEGWVAIVLETDDATAKVTLSNSGPEIPEEARDQLFDRFFRVDSSRASRGNSTGLGLALAREIARAHGGDLVLTTARDGVVAFELTLPSAAAGCLRRRC